MHQQSWDSLSILRSLSKNVDVKNQQAQLSKAIHALALPNKRVDAQYLGMLGGKSEMVVLEQPERWDVHTELPKTGL